MYGARVTGGFPDTGASGPFDYEHVIVGGDACENATCVYGETGIYATLAEIDTGDEWADLPGIGIGLTFASTDADCSTGTDVCYDGIEAFANHIIQNTSDASTPSWGTYWYNQANTDAGLIATYLDPGDDAKA